VAWFDSMWDSMSVWILAAEIVRATWMYIIVYVPTDLASVLDSRLDNIEGGLYVWE
jgi:hypothetical protein